MPCRGCSMPKPIGKGEGCPPPAPPSGSGWQDGGVPGAVKAVGLVGAVAFPRHDGLDGSWHDVGEGGAAGDQLPQERERRHQPCRERWR